MIKRTEELLEQLQEIGNRYQEKLYMKDINQLHQLQNELILDIIKSILKDLYTTSEIIEKYKSEDSLLAVNQNEIIEEKANILPLGTIVLLPKNHNLKGFIDGDSLNLDSTKYSAIHELIMNKLIKKNISLLARASILSRFNKIKNNYFHEYMYIGNTE